MVLQTELESWGADSAHGAGAIRRVGAPPVWIREMILDWDPAVGQVYTVLSPALFSHYRGEIAFEPTEFGGTHIRWTVELYPVVDGWEMFCVPDSLRSSHNSSPGSSHTVIASPSERLPDESAE